MATRKINILLFLLLLLQQGFAQTLEGRQFTLRARLNGTHVDSVLLFYETADGKSAFQCRPVFDDRFIIVDNITTPVDARILFKNIGEVLTNADANKRAKEIYLEPRLLTLTGDAAGPATLKLSGSATQEEFERLDSLTAPTQKDIDNTLYRLSLQNDTRIATAMLTSLDHQWEKLYGIKYRFFLDHPNSYVTAHEMLEVAYHISLDEIGRVYDNFSDELKQCNDVQKLIEIIKNIANVLPGNKELNFVANDINNNKVALDEYKGKYIILSFWNAWDSNSRESNLHLLEQYRKYNCDGLDVITIGQDVPGDNGMQKMIAKDNLEAWRHIAQPFISHDSLFEKYHVYSVPTKILIAPDGSIIGRFGDNDIHADAHLDAKLAQVFSK